MKLVKNIALRVVAIILLFTGANWLYTSYFQVGFLDVHGSLLHNQMQSTDADYLYYSASSEFSCTIKDTNRKSITELMNDQLELNTKPVVLAAHHAEMFAEVIQHLKPNEVTGIIVSLNYRSFSPEWLESHNENSLQQAKTLYAKRPALINRFLLSLNAYDQVDNKTREERFLRMFKEWKLPYAPPKNTVESWCMVEKYGDWRSPKRQLADHYIKNYAFVLHEKSPRLSDFDRISVLAQERNLRLIYVIIPENMEEANDLLGHDLINLMNTNRVFLKERFHKPNQNQFVLDIMDCLNDTNFTDRGFPTEHYDYQGRKQVADSIAHLLNTLEHDY
jgi:hypothetical protein